MIYDIHTHIAQLNRHEATDRLFVEPNRYVRMFLRPLGLTPEFLRRPDVNEMICRKLVDWITTSSIDRAVVLAMDEVYDANGQRDPTRAWWAVENDFVADLAERNRSILFGASIHPYRRDALEELHRAAARGACLVKWIPSSQRIRPDDPRCFPFYELLVHYGIPLLVHTGNEHASSSTLNAWNDPELLCDALRRGVTVIAAHCGTRMFLHERSRFAMFRRMALEYERFYGDLAAFGIPTRIRPLRSLWKNPAILAKIVYGSDFPAIVLPRWFFFSIGRKGVREILRETNPLERPYRLMRALGMPDEVFSRAGQLLRLPKHLEKAP